MNALLVCAKGLSYCMVGHLLSPCGERGKVVPIQCVYSQVGSMGHALTHCMMPLVRMPGRSMVVQPMEP